jgi:gentisate 1,2-dioxygenase
MVPLGFERQSTSSPLLSYPYAKTREALEQLKRHSDWDACYGLKMEFIDPTSGSPAISTISTFVQLMPNGFSSAPYKSTESTIFSIIEGRGTIECTSASGVTTFRYSPRDIIAIPSWNAYTVMCETESIFFCASDRVTKQKLGIWKESR